MMMRFAIKQKILKRYRMKSFSSHIFHSCNDPLCTASYPIHHTKLLGITDHPFKHIVFLGGYEGDNFIVYDFWPPNFTWKFKKIDGRVLFQSVDFTNNDTVQSFYVFKENKAFPYIDNPSIDFNVLRAQLSANQEGAKNEQYDTDRFAYGLSVYSHLCCHLTSLNVFCLADCQNFHVLFEHFSFTQHCLSALFGDFPLVQNALSIYADLVSRANRLRTIVYKHYIAKRDIGDLRTLVLDQVHAMGEIERMAIYRLINDVEGGIS